jgi:hypothetical protein
MDKVYLLLIFYPVCPRNDEAVRKQGRELTHAPLQERGVHAASMFEWNKALESA